MDYNIDKELARVKANGISYNEVNQIYKTYGNVGYHIAFNVCDFSNKKCMS